MKNGYTTTTHQTNTNGQTQINFQFPLQSQVFITKWWDMKGIVYLDLLESRQTVNISFFSEQLMRLDEKI